MLGPPALSLDNPEAGSPAPGWTGAQQRGRPAGAGLWPVHRPPSVGEADPLSGVLGGGSRSFSSDPHVLCVQPFSGGSRGTRRGWLDPCAQRRASNHALGELDRCLALPDRSPPRRGAGGAQTLRSRWPVNSLTGCPPTAPSPPRAERLGEVHLDQHPLQIQDQPEVSAAAQLRGAHPQDHRDQVHHAR